ncbi:hypothetical protein BC833DRAFT_624776 [Globomyces pollinis-pini]|nr:hypothetical protein BC833DRAFT_624776 [Globomyces pollinis-pini]
MEFVEVSSIDPDYEQESFPDDLYKPNGEFVKQILDLLDFAPQLITQFIDQSKATQVNNSSKATNEHGSNTTIDPSVINMAMMSQLLNSNKKDVIINNYNNNNTTNQSSSSKKEKSSKRPTAKSNGKYKFESDSDSEQEKAELKKKEKKEKEKKEKEKESEQNQTQNGILVIVGGLILSAIAATSLFNVAKKRGEIQYVEQFDNIIFHARDVVKSVKIWMHDRRVYQLHIPERVKDDIEAIESICNIVEQLNDRQEKIRLQRTYGLLTVSCGVSFLGLIKRSTYPAIGYIGLGGMFSSLLAYAWIQGRYSSESYTSTKSLFANRALTQCERLKSRKKYE